ncbi:MAG: hypothetical protein ACOYXR_00695 [Nitrospirota bacterium]
MRRDWWSLVGAQSDAWHEFRGCVRFCGDMKRATSIASVWGLALYLALFSGFSLQHAYAQDELTDPHGCLIGAWVQHANATESAAPPLAALVSLSEFLPSSHDAVSESSVLVVSSRGPPRSSQ